jgi:hypothetical protein
VTEKPPALIVNIQKFVVLITLALNAVYSFHHCGAFNYLHKILQTLVVTRFRLYVACMFRGVPCSRPPTLPKSGFQQALKGASNSFHLVSSAKKRLKRCMLSIPSAIENRYVFMSHQRHCYFRHDIPAHGVSYCYVR